MITASLIAIALFTVPMVVAYYQQANNGYTYANSQANVKGPFSIIWGDPYLTPQNTQGTGWASIAIQGRIAMNPTLPGYYTYTTVVASGGLHAEWSDNAGRGYALDANFSLGQSGTYYQSSSYEASYQETTADPSASSFYSSFIYYSAVFNTQGLKTHSSGEAGVKAAAPGYFAQQGLSKVTTFIIYAPSLGDSQYIIRWSWTSQILDGTLLPAATAYSQTVTLSNW